MKLSHAPLHAPRHRTTPRLRQAMMNGDPIDFAAPMTCPKLYPKGQCQGEIVSLSKESNMKALRQECL